MKIVEFGISLDKEHLSSSGKRFSPVLRMLHHYRLTQRNRRLHIHSPLGLRSALSRIKRLAGQITAVEHSVTDGDECADILMLLAAIRGGVNSLMAEILEDHIRLHITHPDTRKESPEELTEDLIALVRAYLK